MKQALFAFALLPSMLPAHSQATTVQNETDLAAALDDLMTSVVEQIDEIPGIGIAIVQDDETVFAGGFGIADIESGRPVTADTGFYIASSTKAFTALSLELLDSRGEFELDRSFAGAVPGIDFADGVPADAATLRQMLSHTGGLHFEALSDRQAYSGDWNPEIAWTLLGFAVANEAAPAGSFDYTNGGYNAVTTIYQRETGESWVELVQSEILDPAGMTRTTASIDTARAEGWMATPYSVFDVPGEVTAAPVKNDSMMHSAGGLVTTPSDAARWLEIQLNDGVLDGERLFPRGMIERTHAPVAEVGEEFMDYQRDGYGLGWYVGRYRDELFLHHFGNYPNYFSHISYMPERGTGVAIFTNEAAVSLHLTQIIANFIYDWPADPAGARAAAERQLADLAAQLESLPGRLAEQQAELLARPDVLSMEMAAYAGTYTNEEYGSIVIEVTDNEMVVHWGGLSSIATPGRPPESVRVEPIPRNGTFVIFDVADGQASGLRFIGRTFTRN
jgi:CubicO group peptidase (beta-lactamase class C family)